MCNIKFYFLLLIVKLHIISLFGLYNSSNTVKFDVRNVSFVTTVDSRFLSFTLDSNQLAKHWKTVNLKNRKLITLTEQLSPAFLRVGGTVQDNIWFCSSKKDFSRNDSICDNETNFRNQTIITESDIKMLAQFVVNTKTNLIYGLNVLQRTKDRSWDPQNSIELMNFMDSVNLKVEGWELGNEPGSFPKTFNQTLSGKRLAKDFNLLRSILSLRHSSSLLLGPDANNIKSFPRGGIRYLRQFLKALQKDTLSWISFHDYSFAGKSANVLNFLDYTYMDELPIKIQMVKKVAQDVQQNHKIFLGETSSAWGGGASNISDRFVSCFMWLDKLGQCALHGVTAVARQTLAIPQGIGNSYGLIDKRNKPTPGYMVSYIYKKLVGSRVLLHTNEFRNNKNLRLYVHCAQERLGEMIIFGMNLGSNPIKMHIVGNKVSQVYIKQYLLTPYFGNLKSRFCNLNGKILQADSEGKMPKLVPEILKGSFINIPATSLGFWILPMHNTFICLSE